jgi:pyruvate formate lyase activating enzyme
MPRDRNQIWGEDCPPTQIVQEALNCQAATISYTYTEPTVYYELAADTARLASQKGVRNVFVSNGYMTKACLEDIYPDLHGANIDLKAFRDGFYKEQCGASLAPVLKTLETLVNQGVWLEVTTLLIPNLNDGIEEMRAIAHYLVGLSPDIPWHISRFHPTYRLTGVSSTPADSIRRARDVGLEAGLKYVYTGNLPGDEGEKTSCHQCGALLINRIGFAVAHNRIKGGECPQCGISIPGVWT